MKVLPFSTQTKCWRTTRCVLEWKIRFKVRLSSLCALSICRTMHRILWHRVLARRSNTTTWLKTAWNTWWMEESDSHVHRRTSFVACRICLEGRWQLMKKIKGSDIKLLHGKRVLWQVDVSFVLYIAFSAGECWVHQDWNPKHMTKLVCTIRRWQAEKNIFKNFYFCLINDCQM